MIVSVMQPYLFPYLGYFQLMAASDVFVSYDDAQYMKGGWINRNRIVVGGKAAWITLPVRKASHLALISQRKYVLSAETRRVFFERIDKAYPRAPHRQETLALLDEILQYPATCVAEFNLNALRALARLLRIEARIHRSSEVAKPAAANAQQKVLAICVAFDASTYLNAAGGRALYSAASFEDRGIQLRFLAPAGVASGLSVLDALMNNDVRTVVDMVHGYRIELP